MHGRNSMQTLIKRIVQRGFDPPLKRTESIPFYRDRRATWARVVQVLEWPHYELLGCYLLLHLRTLEDGDFKCEVFACNPFGSQPGTCYLMERFDHLNEQFDHFVDLIEMFFPNTRQPERFCRILQEALEGRPVPEIHWERSSYVNQLKCYF